MEAFWSDPTAIRNAERAREQASPNLVPRLNALFDKYSGGKKNDTIEIDGTIQWCKDLEVDPEDAVMLAVAELCKASEMGSFERKGWIEGWAKLKYALSLWLLRSFPLTTQRTGRTRSKDNEKRSTACGPLSLHRSTSSSVSTTSPLPTRNHPNPGRYPSTPQRRYGSSFFPSHLLLFTLPLPLLTLTPTLTEPPLLSSDGSNT